MRRTAKKFIDYNEYRDRPFGLKWGTAFAMSKGLLFLRFQFVRFLYFAAVIG
ncbi:hypothetical protein EfmAA96_04640 [Enterococcus faecium]|nr:hypothetical protein EfmAA96_04640 [Enterococcus faecium]